MENKYDEWPKSQKLKKADGTVAYVWDNKLHNWDGPALIPELTSHSNLQQNTFTLCFPHQTMSVFSSFSPPLNISTKFCV